MPDTIIGNVKEPTICAKRPRRAAGADTIISNADTTLQSGAEERTLASAASIAAANGLYRSICDQASEIDDDAAWSRIGFGILSDLIEELPDETEHGRLLSHIGKLNYIFIDLQERSRRILKAHENIVALLTPVLRDVPFEDPAEQLWQDCRESYASFEKAANLYDDWEDPEIKKLEEAYSKADKALMDHQTTTLTGILCKLEFIAHEEIRENASDAVGYTINGLIRDLCQKVGRKPLHTPRGEDSED